MTQNFLVRQTALALSISMTIAACSTRMLPPPRAPTRVAPSVVADLPPPAQGEGEVTFDAVGGPARVEEVTVRTQPSTWLYPSRASYGIAATGETLRPVCVTPCVVHMTAGQHEVRFSSLHDDERSSSDFVSVGLTPVVFRHAIGRRENNWGERIAGIFAIAIGVGAALFGGTMWGLSGVGTPRPGMPDDSEALAHAGAGTLIGGALLVGVGIGLIAHGRPTEQHGASLQWAAP